MSLKFQIRRFYPEDAPQIAQLFHDTIHKINAQDYTPEQLQAWAPANLYFQDWQKRCSERMTWVAIVAAPENLSGLPTPPHAETVIGFAELEPSGHIGCFYTHWHYQGQGIGKGLYYVLEHQAQALGVHALNVEVSITARPFFERLGFTLIQQQQVFCRGAWLTNFQMVKHLTRPGIFA